MLNTLLLAAAAVMILRALRFHVKMQRIPVPPEAPRGLFGWHLLIVRLPAGVGIENQVRCEKANRK